MQFLVVKNDGKMELKEGDEQLPLGSANEIIDTLAVFRLRFTGFSSLSIETVQNHLNDLTFTQGEK